MKKMKKIEKRRGRLEADPVICPLSQKTTLVCVIVKSSAARARV